MENFHTFGVKFANVNMAESLLFGYHAIGPKNLWDFGNDPFFHAKPFSWGICRPNTRTKVEKDTRLFFYTFKQSTKDYFLTGMMKVDQILTQAEAAGSQELYCGKDFNSCPFKIKPQEGVHCSSKEDPVRINNQNNIIIRRRDCRCNIIIDPLGKYKDFCDGGNHIHVFHKYVDKKIYFVSTLEDSVATKTSIRLLDFLDSKTRFWNHGKFYGYELNTPLSRKFENVLRKNEFEQ